MLLTEMDRIIWGKIIVQAVADILKAPDDYTKGEALTWLKNEGAALAQELGIASIRNIRKWCDDPQGLTGDFYTAAEIAEILDVSVRDVQWMCEQGQIVAVPDLLAGTPEPPWLIPAESLTDYMDRRDLDEWEAEIGLDELESLDDDWEASVVAVF